MKSDSGSTRLGQFRLLPKQGLPSALTGTISSHWFIPIILLEDDDEIPKTINKCHVPYHVNDIFDIVINKRIASSLVQIAMRHRWMEEFELAVRINPIKTGVIALIFGHFDLACKLMDDMKVFDVNAMSNEDVFTCIMAISRSGNLEIWKFLEGRHPDWNRKMDHVLALVNVSMVSCHVHILRYIEPMLDDVSAVASLGRPSFHTKHLDCWE
ncbi:hypothetical protein HDU76_009653, partial [Blyttiomyces sp. JEL0837]